MPNNPRVIRKIWRTLFDPTIDSGQADYHFWIMENNVKIGIQAYKIIDNVLIMIATCLDNDSAGNKEWAFTKPLSGLVTQDEGADGVVLQAKKLTGSKEAGLAIRNGSKMQVDYNINTDNEAVIRHFSLDGDRTALVLC